MFFRKQKRINKLEAEVSKLKENLNSICSDSKFRNSVSAKAVSDILNLLSIRGILSDMDCFNMVVPYNVVRVARNSSNPFEEQDRYIINIPNIRLNVPKEVYEIYLKSKCKEE